MKPYTLLSEDRSFAFSAENPTGTRGGGSRGGDCTKLSPTVTVRAGDTVTLADIKGSGVIQNMWFTGYVGHSFILRIYWEEQAMKIAELLDEVSPKGVFKELDAELRRMSSAKKGKK